MTVVPPDPDHSERFANGALENIQRLKEQATHARGWSGWVWWIAVPTIGIWGVRWLLSPPSDTPRIDPDIERQITQQMARWRRSGFNDPRRKELERRIRDYMTGRTTKF